jgi:Tfp pilus assembly protein PilO
MKYLTKDSLIMLGILAAMVICAVVFFYVPASRKLEGTRTAIVTRKTSLEQEARQAAIVPQLLQHVNAMKARYNERWEKKLPQRVELGGFLREISENLARGELSGQLIEPGNPEQEELFHTLPITMRFEGSFGALTDFLEQLDEMERLARVRKLDVVADTKQAPATLAVELLLNIYFTDRPA